MYYTIDQTDPTIHSSYVLAENLTVSLVIDTPGAHTVKALAAAKDSVPSDIVLKRLEVFEEMDQPKLRPHVDGRYDTPLNVTVEDPAVCSVDYLELQLCLVITMNGATRPAQCFPCVGYFVLEDIGEYMLTAYYIADDLVVSKAASVKLTLTRPPFDTKPVHINRKKPFQFKPNVDVFVVSKELDSSHNGCTKRTIGGHHIILHNPLGHFDIMPPAVGCGNGLSLPSDTSKRFGVDFKLADASSKFLTNPSYKRMIETMSREDISLWRKQYKAALDEGASSCTVATNAGFFDIKSFKCLGNIVSQGRVVQVSKSHNVNFGIRNGSFVIGYVGVEESSQKGATEFDTLVSGLVWLVRGGRSYVLDSVAPITGAGKIGDGEDLSIQSNGPNFVNILSARTAIGFDAFGRLMMAQVEGESFVRGMNLLEFADFLVEIGFESAINLDGGGSATISAFNTLITEPSWKCTAEDKATVDDDIMVSEAHNYRVCEKKVSSITCFHPMVPPEDEFLLPSQLEIPVMQPSTATPTSLPSTSHPTVAPSKLSTLVSPTADEYLYDDISKAHVDIAVIEHQLEIYEICTYSFAILLVISVTANCWWLISYSALKRKEKDLAEKEKFSIGAVKTTARAIELSSANVQKDNISYDNRNSGRKQGNNSADDYDIEIFESDEMEAGSDDSYDDESALMSPSKNNSQRGPYIGAGYNPFSRRR